MTLDVFPGSKVVESGTGSGNMTLSLARAVGDNGHVYSYEYNATRAAEAAKEFEMCVLSLVSR
jgi:tRNA (adenine57-N1/adenine58-N1)-methyltransferase catalytic subunit